MLPDIEIITGEYIDQQHPEYYIFHRRATIKKNIYLYQQSYEYRVFCDLSEPKRKRYYYNWLMETVPIKFWIDHFNIGDSEICNLIYESEGEMVDKNVIWIIKDRIKKDKDKDYTIFNAIMNTPLMSYIWIYFDELEKIKGPYLRRAIVSFIKSGKLGHVQSLGMLDSYIAKLGDPKIARIRIWEMDKRKNHNVYYGYLRDYL